MDKKLLKWHASYRMYCKICKRRDELPCLGCRTMHRRGRRLKIDIKELCPTNVCFTNKELKFCYEYEEYPSEKIQPIVNFENPSVKCANIPHNLKYITWQ